MPRPGFRSMATQPTQPDTINPGAPPEMPPEPGPAETPFNEPPGIEPPQPDYDNPDPEIPGVVPQPD